MMRSLDKLMGAPVDEMTDEEIERAIKYHREQLLGEVGTPNIYVRLADLERVAKERRLEGVPQGYQIAIALYDPHMKKLGGEVVSYISSVTAKTRLKEGVDALMDRNWLVMNDEDITNSFEETTGSKPDVGDIVSIRDRLEATLDGGSIIGHINEIMDDIVHIHIEKKEKP